MPKIVFIGCGYFDNRNISLAFFTPKIVSFVESLLTLMLFWETLISLFPMSENTSWNSLSIPPRQPGSGIPSSIFGYMYHLFINCLFCRLVFSPLYCDTFSIIFSILRDRLFPSYGYSICITLRAIILTFRPIRIGLQLGFTSSKKTVPLLLLYFIFRILVIASMVLIG